MATELVAEVERGREIEDDVALLRANGVRVWNSLVVRGKRLIQLRGGEEEGLRAADIALSLGLPINSVFKQWHCTSLGSRLTEFSERGCRVERQTGILVLTIGQGHQLVAQLGRPPLGRA